MHSKHEEYLATMIAPDSRRHFFAAAAKMAGAVGVGAALYGQSTTPENTDISALNYALTLEYLEASFYNQFLGAAPGSTGMVGTVAGTPRTFTASDALASPLLVNAGTAGSASLFRYLTAIRDHELAHVSALRSTIRRLGGTPVEPCSYRFDAVTTFDAFLQTAQALENTGVAAYDGAINMIVDKMLLQTAATIATVEARHAAFLNIVAGGVFAATMPTAVTSSIPGVSPSPFPSAFDTALAPGQVLAIAGPFLGTCSTPLPTPTAVVTFSPAIPATITQSSIVLTPTVASTIAGPARVQYSVSPGGKVPAILQNPSNNNATIQFVSGAGAYNLLVTVTDANGQVTTMPVTLMYQP